jgi:N-ethylmaleimide reductase
MTTATLSPQLLSPFDLQGLNLKNRVVLAPLTRSRAGESRIPNALIAEYYLQRASAGLLISEATSISRQGIGWRNNPGIYNDEQVVGWQLVTEAVHTKNTPIFLQLWHCGRASHRDFQENGQLPVAPSAIKLNGDYIHTPLGKQAYEAPRALAIEEIPLIVADYRRAAERALAAGFDGLEIHAANGYLIDQFLQSKTNQRSDRYGGNIPNRYRFLGEILAAVTEVFPAQRVGVRLSPNGMFNDMGSPDYRETFTYTAQELNKLGLAYLHIMDGLAFGFHQLGEPMTLKEFRAIFQNALMGNCGYTQASAEAAISQNYADLIAFGRPYISNPDLVERFTSGWPLSEEAPMQVWYSFEPQGYTDFPVYKN